MATRPQPPPGETAAPTELMAPPGPPLPPEEPPPDRELWPWLLVLLVLVVAGLAAAWYATRDSSGSSTPRTVQTTVAAPAQPKKQQPTTTAVAQVVVPDVVGQQRDDAVATLEAQGLSASLTDVPSTQEQGVVVAQSPRGGEKVDKGSSVAVNVSKGPNKPEPVAVTVPDVVGQPVDSAAAAVKGAGLHPSVQHVPSNDAEGTVVSQSPSGGSSADKGAGVLLNVSSGPAQAEAKPDKNEQSRDQHQPASVPSVVGQDKETAKSDLKSAGFKVSTVDQPTNDPSQDGTVVDQSPSAGTSAPQNSNVTIYVGRFDSG